VFHVTRFGAFGILCNMIGAIFLVHPPHGFFMNWFGKQAGEGFSSIALPLLVTGGGRWLVDGGLAKRLF